MTDNGNNKLRLLAILEYLYSNSDEDHLVKSLDIINYLKNKYNIDTERKTVYRDIKSLNDFGIDVATASRKGGFFMAERKFELPELKLLLDAVLTAPFITEKKTAVLVDKIYSLMSNAQSEKMKKQTFLKKRVKQRNEYIYYNIDSLNTAIIKSFKVKFTYYHNKLSTEGIIHDDGNQFQVSPYALIWSNDKYYLVCNCDKYDDLSHFRIDRMSNVEIIEEHIRPYSDVSEYTDYFDSADYASKSFNMFTGEPGEIELLCDISLFEAMLDKFGYNASYNKIGNDKFTIKAEINISDGFLDWFLPYSDRCIIKSPSSLRERMFDKFYSVFNLYLKNNRPLPNSTDKPDIKNNMIGNDEMQKNLNSIKDDSEEIIILDGNIFEASLPEFEIDEPDEKENEIEIRITNTNLRNDGKNSLVGDYIIIDDIHIPEDYDMEE